MAQEEDVHFPPGSPEAKAAEEAAAKAQADAEAKAAEEKAAAEAADQAKAEEEAKAKAEAQAKAKENENKKPSDPPEPLKKRSIYNDLKDKKQEVKDYRAVAVAALKAQGIELSGKETAAELQALMQQHKTPDAPEPPAPDPKPEEKPKPADDLEAYAQEQGLDAKALGRLVEIIQKRIPAAQLTDEEKQGLADLKKFRADQARATEDREVLDQAPQVRAQLKELGHEIHDEAEAQNVMKEIVRLSHTERYHDKEVGYIVWSERQALSKLISPKKPSFERGTESPAEGKDEPIDFSNGSKVTPEAAQRSLSRPRPKDEIRPAK